MKLLAKIKKLPNKTKRLLAILSAFLLTIILISINVLISSIWREEPKIVPYNQEDPIKSMANSFTKIFNVVQPMLDNSIKNISQVKDEIISEMNATSSTSSAKNTASGTEQIIDQNNSTSSSVSTSSNIVR